jgi:hypothetical protein
MVEKNIKERIYKNHIRHDNKRGQIETFGLAFIVILISLGFFMFVSFQSKQKPDNRQIEYSDDKLPEDFVLSVLKVTVDNCEDFSVKDLIVDCARDKKITCGYNGISSCIAVNESITIMLNKTFMVKDVRDYRFRFYSENLYNSNGDPLINITYLNCTPKSRQGRTGEATIPLYPSQGDVRLKMNICH